jgi:hypothetical protein
MLCELVAYLVVWVVGQPAGRLGREVEMRDRAGAGERVFKQGRDQVGRRDRVGGRADLVNRIGEESAPHRGLWPPLRDRGSNVGFGIPYQAGTKVLGTWSLSASC